MARYQADGGCPEPAELLRAHAGLLVRAELPGPVLDLAAGDCRNGIFAASLGLPVICCDRSAQALAACEAGAAAKGVSVALWPVDLERGGNPLPVDLYGAILVFRYLHRPLFPHIKAALRPGGLLLYETYTVEQTRFGKPTNPDFLLRPGELREAFADYELLHAFEGVLENPRRAAAQIVCRKPRPAQE